MATSEHPSGEWSSIYPWETTLVQARRIKNRRSDDIEFIFKRGGQEYVYSTFTTDFPNLHYAIQLGDEEMASALEQATFHQAIRELDPVFSRMVQPNHPTRQLNVAGQEIVLGYSGTEDQCEYRLNTEKIVETHYEDSIGLPLYDWQEFQILEAFKGGFKVQACPGTVAGTHSMNAVFGCVLFKDKQLAAEGAYRDYFQKMCHLTNAVIRNEFHDDNDVGGGEHLVPRLKALIRVDKFSTKIVGFLFSWIESSTKAPCLRQLSPNDLRDGRSGYLATRCHFLFQKYWQQSFHIVAQGRKDHILDMVCISTSGRPFIRLPDLGTYEKTSQRASNGRMRFGFSPLKHDDDAALERIFTFLRDMNIQIPRFITGKLMHECHLSKLSNEVLDMILEYLLLRPYVQCTEVGFCAWPPVDTAILQTCSQFRRLGLRQFMRNSFIIDYKFLGTFLRHVAGICVCEEDRWLCNTLPGNDKFWASLQDITLLVSDDLIEEMESLQSIRMCRLWHRSGRALKYLLQMKEQEKSGKANRVTKVKICMISELSLNRPEPKFRELITSFKHFSDFASVELSVPKGEEWWYTKYRALLPKEFRLEL